VDERIDAAKRQLELVPTPDDATKSTLKYAVSELDQVRRPSMPDRNIFGSPTVQIGVSLKNITCFRFRRKKEALQSSEGMGGKEEEGSDRAKRKPPRQEGANLSRQPNSGGVMKQPIGLLVPATIVWDGSIWQTHTLRVNSSCIL